MSQSNIAARAAVYEAWNAALKTNVSKFSSEHPDATTMIFSSHELFHKVLDNPTSYGFTKHDVTHEDGSIWFDAIHISTKMHAVVANAVMEFLQSQPATQEARPPEQ